MRRRLAALLLAATASCSDPAPAPPGPAATLEPVSAQDLRFAAGPEAVATLAVRVRDARGRPVPGVTVRWSSESVGLEPSETLTDAMGEARATWRLGEQVTGALPRRAEAIVTTAAGPRVIGFSARIDAGPVVIATVLRADTLPRRTGLVLEVGQRARFTTFGRDAFGNAVQDAQAAWSTADPSRATVEATTGVVTGVAQGAVRVLAAIPTASPVANATILVVDRLRAREVAVGESWSCALEPAATIACWGARFSGAFAPSDSVIAPPRVAPTLRFDVLAGGAAFACGLDVGGGAAWCWSARDTGVVPPTPAVPVRALAGGNALVSLAVGDAHVCASTAAGAVRCATLRPDVARDTLVAGAAREVALPARALHVTASDSIGCAATGAAALCWTVAADGVGTPTPLAGAGSPVRVEASPTRLCVLDVGGTARCAARSAAGIGEWTSPWTEPTARIAVGTAITCGITRDARLLCVAIGAGGGGLLQRRDFDPPVDRLDAISPDGSGWRAVAVSDAQYIVAAGSAQATPHACGVTGAGRTYCWGANTRGQLGVPNAETCGTRPSIPCAPTPLPVPSARD